MRGLLDCRLLTADCLLTRTADCLLPTGRRAELRPISVEDPGNGEAQVRTLANGICMFEVSLFTGAEPTEFPREVGHEGIGVVEKVGKGVSRLKEGDIVTCGKWRTLQNVR